jgi:hypothetical protein
MVLESVKSPFLSCLRLLVLVALYHLLKVLFHGELAGTAARKTVHLLSVLLIDDDGIIVFEAHRLQGLWAGLIECLLARFSTLKTSFGAFVECKVEFESLEFLADSVTHRVGCLRNGNTGTVG